MQKHYAAGEIIVRREEIVAHLIRIETGRVRFEAADQVWFLKEGACFGEEGVFLGKPAPSTALSSEETRVTLFPETEAEAFLSANPVPALRAVLRMTTRLHERTEPFSPENRRYLSLLKVLLPYASPEKESPSFTRCPFDRSRLAEMAGVDEETMQRLIAEAAPFGDLRVEEDGALSVREAEYLRRRIVEGRCAAGFSAAAGDA